MLVLKLSVVLCHLALVFAQGPTTTPVPILKQINKQNDDGSYSYGYEAADGSFKIETKYPSGDVAGKYGYVDENGKLREISYGASSKRGFEPQGAGIVVPPPSISEPSSNALTDGQEDDGQYREDPKIYEDPKYNSRTSKTKAAPINYRFEQPGFPQNQPAFTQSVQPAAYQSAQPAFSQSVQPQPTFAQNVQPEQPSYQGTYQPNYQRQTYSNQNSIFNQFPQQFPRQDRPLSQAYHQQPQFSFQSYQPQQYQPQQYQPNYNQYQSQNYQYPNQNYNPFLGHPAQNFDPSTGSYTINFTG